MISWVDIKPGEIPVIEEGEGTALILPGGLQVADWVRLPEELGGTRHRVISGKRDTCLCGGGEDVTHVGLEGTDICVCECHKKGFLWYREVKDDAG